MIPKIIHYCWLSNDPIPQNLQTYMKSWRAFLPDYEFMLWDFNRFDKTSSIWVQEAFDKKKYAFAADYIRLYAVYNYGGFYFDMDVEVLKSFDDLLNMKSVICWQDGYEGVEAACFGAEKGASWLKACLDYYQNKHFINSKNKMELRPLPSIMEETLKETEYGIESVSSIKDVLNAESNKQIVILPNYFFSPKSYQTGKINKTEQTYAIHHFAASWVNPYDNKSFLGKILVFFHIPPIGKIWHFFHLPNTNIRKHLFKKQNQSINL